MFKTVQHRKSSALIIGAIILCLLTRVHADGLGMRCPQITSKNLLLNTVILEQTEPSKEFENHFFTSTEPTKNRDSLTKPVDVEIDFAEDQLPKNCTKCVLWRMGKCAARRACTYCAKAPNECPIHHVCKVGVCEPIKFGSKSKHVTLNTKRLLKSQKMLYFRASY
jgi:hypothetical protein